jgi:N utilization substance protein B
MPNERQEIATFNTRVAAVQCSYSVIFSGEKLSKRTIDRFMGQEFLRDVFDASGEVEINPRLFAFLARGIVKRQKELDERIGALLRVPIEKNDPLFVGIIRAGAFELMYRADVPAKVVISEYIRVAEAFLPESKISAVNAVLDKIKPAS